MSIGNTNFITLDSIAEIQDIVDGDYVFTVSNGVIYKLDFQNFVIPLQNVDFASTIESMSAQLVSLTNAFSSINTTLNLLSAITGIPGLSANWTSTWRTVNALSGTNWLPHQDTVQPGSVVYYAGGNTGWKASQAGKEGNVLTIQNAIPTFGGSSTFGGIDTQTAVYETGSTAADHPVIETMSFATQQEYAALQINWDVQWTPYDDGALGLDTLRESDQRIRFSTGSFNLYEKGTVSVIENLSRLYVQYDPTTGLPDQVYQGGLVYLPKGTNGPAPVNFYVIPQMRVVLENYDPPTTAQGNAAVRTEYYFVGEATTLGTGATTTRWEEDDPTIIRNVFNNELPDGLLGRPNNGIPYIWDLHQKGPWPASGPVYEKCRVTLNIQAN